MSQNRYYKQSNLYAILTTLTQVVAGPGSDQANRMFSAFIQNTGSSLITVVFIDNQGDSTSFVIPLAAGSPGLTFDNLPWETVAGGMFATATGSSGTLLAGLWASDIKRESLLNIPAFSIPSSYESVTDKSLTIVETVV